MVKTVKITTDNEISILELLEWNLSTMEAAIEADCTEAVKTQRMVDLFQDSIVMIVDESGHRKNKPDNLVASILYGVDIHGCPIAGDVIFAVRRGLDDLPPENPELLKYFLKALLSEWSGVKIKPEPAGREKFCIEVKEVLCRNIVLEADNLEEAERIVSAAYEKGYIALGAQDCQDSTVKESVYVTGKELEDMPLTDIREWR